MITAFARVQGSTPASPATAALERSPTPPPNRTNRAKEASGPGLRRAGVTGSRRTTLGPVFSAGSESRAANAVSGFDRSSAVMGDSFRGP